MLLLFFVSFFRIGMILISFYFLFRSFGKIRRYIRLVRWFECRYRRKNGEKRNTENKKRRKKVNIVRIFVNCMIFVSFGFFLFCCIYMMCNEQVQKINSQFLTLKEMSTQTTSNNRSHMHYLKYEETPICSTVSVHNGRNERNV